jgi:EAL domain-containing protein (putative c-di-GMP-specific phosphodiesterase class I)
MHAHAVEALTLERELRRAIERHEIRVHYQPIFSLSDQRLVGFESLARWDSETLGPVSPLQFIPLAEETGLIIPLGMAVLNEACQQMHKWHTQFPSVPKLSVSVNLSSKQFQQLSLVDHIKDALRKTKLDPECLQLEITESVIMENAEEAAEMLSQLKALGVKLSIDDFGTGYSSLSYLHSFPFDILKIDRSFVNRMGTDKESTGIIETILILADKLGKRAIAEGIETPGQLADLVAAGCDYGQGYLFSRPIPPDVAEKLFFDPHEQDKSAGEYPGRDVEFINEIYAM